MVSTASRDQNRDTHLMTIEDDLPVHLRSAPDALNGRVNPNYTPSRNSTAVFDAPKNLPKHAVLSGGT
jgi:hypothetical protein